MSTSGKIIVLDNFYDDPFAVRRLALSCKYRDIAAENYPGYQSLAPVISRSVLERLGTAVGATIDYAASRQMMGFFRYIPEHKTSRLKVHTDMLDWTVVIYLTPDGDPTAGTRFYRHRATGLYGPPSRAQMRRFGYRSFADYERRVVVPDTLKPQAWEEVDAVDYRFNRCVIFKANEMFHSHHKGFGDGLTTARMTQNFFFNVR